MAKCSFSECRNQARNLGLCATHRRQQLRGEDLHPIAHRVYTNKNKVCSFPECGRPGDSFELCKQHAAQRRKGQELHPIGDREWKSRASRAAWDRKTPEEQAAHMALIRAGQPAVRTIEHRQAISEAQRVSWARRQGREIPPRHCRGCDVEFTPTGLAQAFCTIPCRRLSYRLAKHGIDRAEWQRMYDEQQGRCALCGTDSKGWSTLGRLHLDHCHKTGRVRGILCGDCNTALGRFGDDPARLRAAADYLERFSN